ncbi:hypothetical protein FRC17_002201 [Serendipita sp. 399]|nr:hypothetical protein FRC17_002201 [Serendipita sp. 399]
MALLGRSDILDKINQNIDVHRLSCNNLNCHYLEDIKKELRYSVLSHRWGDHEIVFHHMQMPSEELAKIWELSSTSEKLMMLRNIVPSATGPSIDKISWFLDISKTKGCQYAWMDTICINKGSSSELDESIRSMYGWYRDSYICIVHLSKTVLNSHLGNDPWFTRGWTLQELLAPSRFAFYSKDWKQLTRVDCTKRSFKQAKQRDEESESRLWTYVEKVTGIDAEDLHNFKPGVFDIRKRMSWISRRTTTRIEDMAYCLIGIFNVNLSTAYGEKEAAFYRLQMEILQSSNDISIFDWQGQASIFNSMLAKSPACFTQYFGLRKDTSLPAGDDPTFVRTNVGIRIPLAIYPLSQQVLSSLGLNLPKTPTVFSILGASPKPDHYVMLLLGEGDQPRQYERLALVEVALNMNFFHRDPVAIYIK